VSALLRDIPPAAEVVERIRREFLEALDRPLSFPQRGTKL